MRVDLELLTMRLHRDTLDTLDKHYLKRIGCVQLSVLHQARDFYARLGYVDALYYTYNMQYWCVDKSDKDFWSAVRAEVKLIHSYRRDNS
jgi:hypothetical protein